MTMSDKPLITHLYIADPSAHVFEGRIYVYPTHDVDKGIPDDDLGSQYDWMITMCSPWTMWTVRSRITEWR